MILFAALGLAAAQPSAPPQEVTVPAQPELTKQVAARDSELFELFFQGPCDSAKMRGLLVDDLEFYHDKAGFNARSADDFVAIFDKYCADRQKPAAWRSRREMVPGTLHVDPVPGYGAIQTGEHLFYEKEGADGVEKLAGRARFAQLWVLGEDGAWRLSRVFSYAHGPAE
jgi:hypothetical protein